MMGVPEDPEGINRQRDQFMKPPRSPTRKDNRKGLTLYFVGISLGHLHGNGEVGEVDNWIGGSIVRRKHRHPKLRRECKLLNTQGKRKAEIQVG